MKLRLLVIIVFIFNVLPFAIGQEYQAKKSEVSMEENGQKFYIHTVEKGNTLYNISKLYMVSVKVLEQVNPAILDGLQIGMDLKIPFHTPQSDDYIYHIVKKKETVYQIAKIYNVKEEDVTAVNDLVDGNIKVGQYLKIPSMFVQADQNTLFTEASEKADEKVDDSKYKLYKVKAKETMFIISKRYGISVDAIMYLNDLNSSDISEGQSLLMPKKLFEPQEKPSSNKDYIEHKVKAKETLFGVAKQYAVSMNLIVENNDIVNQQLQLGQVLKIPRKQNETAFIEHQVTERKDKLSKLAGKYSVSVEDLQAANPKAGEKLKKGQRVLIPVGFIESDFEEELVEEEVATQEVGEELVDEQGQCPKQIQDRTFHVALMLPMYLSDIDSIRTTDTLELLDHKYDRSFKFLEFYEGAILAARELDSLGLDFEMHVYDIPREAAETNEILKAPELQNMDLMISLLYSKSFEVVSHFSKEHQIPLVNVKSKRRKILYDNPYVFKIEPNEDFLINQVVDYVINQHKNDNIIIVRSNPYQLANEYKELEENIKQNIPYLVSVPNADILYKVSSYELDYPESNKDFQSLLTKKLSTQLPGFDYNRIQAFPEDSLVLPNHLQTVVYSRDSLAGIVNASSHYRNNLVLALGNEEVFGIELFTKLNFVRDSFDYEVIGMPFWQEYYGLDVNYTQPMKLKVLSNRYVDYERQVAKDFVIKFRETYGIEPQMNRHAFLGYDVTKYFLSALMDYGSDFTNCLDEIDVELLENQLEFRKIPDAGYENIHWNLLLQQDFKYHLLE